MGKKSTDTTSDGQKKQNRQWTPDEDAILVECLLDMASMSVWKGDNGTFKSGFAVQLEKWMEQKLPGCGLKATPHIGSRVKLFKKHYNAIAEMLGPNASGFGWNDQEKMIVVEKHVFDDWVKGHPNAKGLRNKRFPHYDDLTIVYGKDRANGNISESAVDIDAVEETDVEEETQTPMDDVEIEGDTGIQENDGIASVEQSPMPTQGGISKKPNKKRSRSNDALAESLLDSIQDFGKMYGETSRHVATIASCFKTEAAGTERRMEVFNELLQIGGLSRQERLKAGELLTADTHKSDYFCSLPEDYKYDYVMQVLTDAGVHPMYNY